MSILDWFAACSSVQDTIVRKVNSSDASEYAHIIGCCSSRFWGAFWLLELARIHRALGNPGEALVACQRSAVVQRRIGDRNREAAAHDGTGEAYRDLGRMDDAAKFHRMAITVYRETRDRWGLANALVNLAVALSGTSG